jgi:cell division protein FtsI (penicillin-binding protein 3)
MSSRDENVLPTRRLATVLTTVGVAALALLWRAVDLQVFDRDFLQEQGDARHLRQVSIAAHRGVVVDRNGEPLAISTPVDSVWVNPKLFIQARDRWSELADLLDMSPRAVADLVDSRSGREFVYIRRHIAPERADRIREHHIPGVFLQREYRRYYPTGEVTAHVVGFTDIDDQGIEGVELQYDDWLRGTPGAKRVLKDRLGRTVKDVESLRPPEPGHALRLSIDRRLQYLAYRELKAAVRRHGARSGSAVVLDAKSGEVLAMVNQPSYNPNSLEDRGGARSRNRAVTDVFEPGSTLKPFTIAAALESGKYSPHTRIDTSPGFLRFGTDTVRDHRNYGLIDVAMVLKKSSNVGASLMALSLDPQTHVRLLSAAGFGVTTGSGFPGEAAGILPYRSHWSDIERATLSYGYGVSVTPLQLAHAYTVFANDGLLKPVTFVADGGRDLEPTRVLDARTARQVRAMLEGVVSAGGTGTRAAVPGYRVAGKTGTAHKAGNGGYAANRYLALFAGMAPASDPRLVMAVVIDEPSVDEYYGGLVAAPVFSRVMAGALRLLNVPPDDLDSLRGHMASAEGYVR